MFSELLETDLAKILGFLGLSSILAIISFILGLFKVPKIVRVLIRNNRDHPENGFGNHFADRFIEIWFLKVDTTNDSPIYGKPNYPKTRQVDKKLEELGLIKISGNRIE